MQRLDVSRQQGWTESTPYLDNSGLALNAQPPIAGSQSIIAISTVTDLYAEGIFMGYCIASYIDRIERGEVFVYRVLEPERATLTVSIKIGGYQISEIRRVDNMSVSEITLQTVNYWIKAYDLGSADEQDLIAWKNQIKKYD